MFQVENVQKAYGGIPILDGVSFTLNRRERVALVGLNGSGKSTLMRILTGQESADGGNVAVPKGYQVGYLQQHLTFTAPTVREEGALGLRPEESDQWYKAEAILTGLGFSQSDLDEHPGSFSGGFQLRIELAKTLVGEPDCLLLDEPTNYLDIVTIQWLRDFLKNWRGEMITISHDRHFLDAISTHTMGVHRKKLLKVSGGTAVYYDQLLLIEETHGRTVQKQEKKRAHAENFIRRFGSKATKAKQAQSRLKMMNRMDSLEKLAEIHHLNFSFQEAPHAGKRMITVDHLSFGYPGMDEPLIEDVTLEIHRGDRIAIVGENGRGKSTLLRLLLKELAPDDGKLSISDNAKIGYFGQTHIQRLHSDRTILQEISAANPNLSHGQVRSICGAMMFSGTLAEKKVGILSGGEKSRVLLGQILARPCNLLLLDEPSNHLDLESVEALMEALEKFSGAVIIVTHVEELLERIPERLILCSEEGQELFLGDYTDFLEKRGWDASPLKKKAAPKQKETDKQVKAKARQEQSQITAPIKKKCVEVEKNITTTEQELQSLNEQMQNAENMGVLVKEMGIKQKELDSLYSELEKLESQLIDKKE